MSYSLHSLIQGGGIGDFISITRVVKGDIGSLDYSSHGSKLHGALVAFGREAHQ